MFECAYCYKSLKLYEEIVIACNCEESAKAKYEEMDRKSTWERDKKSAEELQRRERELNRIRRRHIK
jgi:hypothetical protein